MEKKKLWDVAGEWKKTLSFKMTKSLYFQARKFVEAKRNSVCHTKLCRGSITFCKVLANQNPADLLHKMQVQHMQMCVQTL